MKMVEIWIPGRDNSKSTVQEIAFERVWMDKGYVLFDAPSVTIDLEPDVPEPAVEEPIEVEEADEAIPPEDEEDIYLGE